MVRLEGWLSAHNGEDVGSKPTAGKQLFLRGTPSPVSPLAYGIQVRARAYGTGDSIPRIFSSLISQFVTHFSISYICPFFPPNGETDFRGKRSAEVT